jgi:hypothetical protein
MELDGVALRQEVNELDGPERVERLEARIQEQAEVDRLTWVAGSAGGDAGMCEEGSSPDSAKDMAAKE